MGHAPFVSVRERVGNLDSVALRTRNRKRPLADDIRERAAVDTLHDDERLAIRAADFIDVTDVGMAEPRGVLRFPPQPGLCVLAVERRDLQGNVATELCVARRVHPPHAAAAQEMPDLVMTDRRGRSAVWPWLGPR